MAQRSNRPDGPPDRTVQMRHTDGPIASLDFEVAPEALEVLGDYELLFEIGTGGMGRVYKARQKSLGRVVALKTILSPELASVAAVHRFRKEAEAAGQLDHPGIVPVYEFNEHGGQLYFTMAFVEGRGLDERLRQGPLDNRHAALVVQKVAEAVAYAHRKGVVHRDLKPANVLLDRDGGVKVTDFGIARRLNAQDVAEPEPAMQSAHPELVGTVVRLTQFGAILGTPGYMAPEQARDSSQTERPADVWSLGAILYACLTGRPPFRGADALETLALTVKADPVPPNVINPDVDLDLVQICLRCLRKKPEERYASADEVAERLALWRDGRVVRSPWGAWRKRAARFFSDAPELVPLTAGLIVHRLGNIQEGLLVGCALAGVGLAARRRSAAPVTWALIVNVLFLVSLSARGVLADGSPWLAAVLASAAGLLSGAVTLACGFMELESRRPGQWSPVRVGAVCLPIALVGLGLAVAVSLGAERLREAGPASSAAALVAERYVGRVASWFLAVPLGLGVGALLGRLNERLDRFGRAPSAVFVLGAALAVVFAFWAFREARPDGVTESARFSFLGPGPALSLAEERAGRWLAVPSAEVRWAAAGIFWLKLLLLAGPMILGGLAAGLAMRLWNADQKTSRA